MQKQRCPWVNQNPLMIEYHDKEWGTPLKDDNKLFEFLVLDAFQAGLSWNTIINKRENFSRAFDNFDPEKIAKYTEKDKERLMQDAGIIRNRLKIESAITNAKAFLKLKETQSFSDYIWQFVNNKTIKNNPKNIKDYQSKSKESDTMSKDLKEKGFKFVGSTICYAFMQAAGLINDHSADCFRNN
ncbi:DNA-3-methyladenine glycosylase I [Candidatus Pacearchaeota archaeon]|nr:DNA-3-methyladenine glycosylase I [Candidatus Pacearchaeota archaeon]